MSITDRHQHSVSRTLVIPVVFLVISFHALADGLARADSRPTDLATLVDQAVNAYVRKDGAAKIVELGPYGDAVLPYLKKYVSNANMDVRYAAAMIAANAESEAAIPILDSTLRGDTAMCDFLFECFSPEIVRNRGGIPVRDNLIWCILHGNGHGRIIVYPLLLTSFRNDPVVLEFLKGLQRMEIVAPSKIVSMPPLAPPAAIARLGAVAPPMSIPDLGECYVVEGHEVPYEFGLHLALANLHQRSDEEAVLWRLRHNDVTSINCTLYCARYVTNKRLLLALVELTKNHTLTDIPKPGTLGGDTMTDASYMRVCDYAVGMLTTTLQVDVGIPDLTAVALKKQPDHYRRITFDSLPPVRQYTEPELKMAYDRLKAAVEKMKDQ
ncbi:MAG: hypothetical protein P4L33_00675 [Capsulimonadaceae bacterium]|nr:hypothetical protein [Capsulimonadaceae bacterium]